MSKTDQQRAACLAAALLYARKGIEVFPGVPGEKKSYKSKQHSEGRAWGKTNKEGEIRADWRRWPDADVCIVTGKASGIWVLDVDTAESHGGRDGIAALAALENAQRPLPITKTVRTPSGGIHYYFRWPAEGEVRNSSNELGEGIDVRGEGGMVVAPPSIKGDKAYVWEDNARISDAPDWLLRLVVSNERDAGAGSNAPTSDKLARIEKVRAALDNISNDDFDGEKDWDTWNIIGMSVWVATSQSPEGYEAFRAWSAKSKKYNEQDCYKAWYKRFPGTPPESLGFGKLWHYATEENPQWLAVWREENPEFDAEDQEAAEAAAEAAAMAEYENEDDDEDDEDDDEGEDEGGGNAGGGAAGDGEPEEDDNTVKIVDAELGKTVKRTMKLLVKKKVHLYKQGHILVYPVSRVVKAARNCETIVTHLREADPAYMVSCLHEHLKFLKYDGRKRRWKPVMPPTKLIALLLADPNKWPFHEIEGVISTPTLRPDGSLLINPGYDHATRMLLCNPPLMPPMSDKPTKGDALAALALLGDLLSEFPLIDDISKAVALSGMLTPVVRPLFAQAPMHINRAPAPGSGKSYLNDIISGIAIGQKMPVISAGTNPEELDKGLGALVLANQSLISIDNVNGEVGSNLLCVLVERPTVRVRILGKSDTNEISTSGFTVFCNGNNVVMINDMARRSIQLVLDSRLERPELRTFTKDPFEMVMADRGKYVAACLTIVRAYLAAGSPSKARPYASFEGWSDTVRSALMWAGCADPVASAEAIRAEDPQLMEHITVVENIHEIMGDEKTFTLAELIEVAEEPGESGGYNEFQYKWPELNAALAAVAKYRSNQPFDLRRLGIWMRAKKDKVVGQFVLRNKSDPKGGSKWWVDRLDTGGRPLPPIPGLRAGTKDDKVVRADFSGDAPNRRR